MERKNKERKSFDGFDGFAVRWKHGHNKWTYLPENEDEEDSLPYLFPTSSHAQGAIEILRDSNVLIKDNDRVQIVGIDTERFPNGITILSDNQ